MSSEEETLSKTYQLDPKDHKIRLSVSKTKTFLDCKKKYHFNYVLKVPVEGDFEHLIFGKFLHKVLEDFHLSYLSGSTLPHHQMMTQCFNQARKDKEFPLTKEQVKEATNICKQYLVILGDKKKNNQEDKILSCEKNFNIHIKDQGIDVNLTGMIDRIQMDPDGVIHVVDYKTNKNDKYLKKDYFQLLTYAYVLLQDDPSLERIRTSYIMLKDNFRYITVEFDKEQILKIKDKFIDYAAQILAERDFSAKPTPLCGYCAYLNLCEEGMSRVGKGDQFFGESSW